MTDIALITIDSLRHDHLGCYGYERNTSPNIDQLAGNSHQFLNAFAHAGMTRASFPTILTSSYTNMYGGYDRITEGRTLVSEVLTQGGYSTAGFHSNLFLCADFGYQRGFDMFYDSKTDPSFTAKLRQFIKTNLNQDSILYNFLQRLYDTTEKNAGLNVGSSYVKADEITDRSIEWVTKTEADSSDRFLWTHYMDVHHPYVPPEEYQLKFRDTSISDRRSIKLRRKMLEIPEEISENEQQELIDLYDAEIRFTDHEIGRLIDSIEESWGEDTIILITADHGEEFYEHGQYSHNTVHDEGIHVPLILSTDGSGVYDEMVGLVDVSPTIANYAGCDIPDNFYGSSLKPLVEKGKWARDHVIGDWGGSEGKPDRIFYRDKDWKYIKNRGNEELYRLDEDPAEKNDIISQKPSILTKIREKIETHEKQVTETSMDIDEVEMDDEVEERLEKLGYKF
ncbi:sulfatase [Halonotius roseus]|uniref:Sulfatase n=1 Tax=Halonotius roseus TaxID=2511997 RepID=A0A544QMZ3_9EURY|nr:sulfatase [Halonotius roseus]TQQ80281.1 sulfatase [Halonotius roseus]